VAHGNIDILENFTGSDALGAVTGQDQVVTFLPGVFASDGVDEGEGRIELPGFDQKTCAIGCPFTSHTSHWSSSFGGGNEEECRDNCRLTIASV